MAYSEASDTADFHPDFVPLWDAVKHLMPTIGSDIHAMRRMVIEGQKGATAALGCGPTAQVIEQDIAVVARDGYRIPCIVYKPATPPRDGSPLVITFHGGGFVAGVPANEEVNCRNFAARLGCTCLNVDFRLAPEHRFPVPHNDAWDATKWAAANAASLGADPKKGFILAGTSTGSTLVDSIAHIARDENLAPAVTGLLEIATGVIPYGQPPEQVKAEYLSYDQSKDAPILTPAVLDWMMDNLKPDYASPLAFPFIHAAGHKGMPPVFFQVCGLDPLRDDAVIYERVLREQCGVKTRLKLYPGLPHCWWTAFPQMELSRQFVNDTVVGAEWLLGLVGTLQGEDGTSA